MQFALPEGLGFVVVAVATCAAGWFLASEPMQAALFFLLPAVVLGAIRVIAEEGTAPIGAMLFGLVIAVMTIAVFTHLGAGVALRRQATGRR